MLPIALTLLLTQLPATPQVLVPGATYEAALLDPIHGLEAVELCDAIATATEVELRGTPTSHLRTVAPSRCGSPVLLVGRLPEPGSRITTAAETRSVLPGERTLLLDAERWVLRWRPYSDGGVRVTEVSPLGEEHLLFESAAPGASLELLWAGDLNDDGRLDLVVEASEGFIPFQQLLLSGEDGLPHLVAETLVASR